MSLVGYGCWGTTHTAQIQAYDYDDDQHVETHANKVAGEMKNMRIIPNQIKIVANIQV